MTQLDLALDVPETVTQPAVSSALSFCRASDDAAHPDTLPNCVASVTGSADVGAKSLTAFRTAVSTLARVTGIPATELPAAPALLRPILKDILPAAHGMSEKRWRNLRSDLSGLLFRCGWVAVRLNDRRPLPTDWETVVNLGSRKNGGSPLPSFGRFCTLRGLAPSDVASPDLVTYEEFRTERTLDQTPRATVNALRKDWNRVAQRAPELRLSSLGFTSQVIVKARPVSDFPASFGSDLAAWIASMRQHDPLNMTGQRKLAPLSIEHHRRSALRAATYLAASGTPMAEITTLATLTTEPAMRAVAMAIFEESGRKWTRVAEQVVGCMLAIAQHWVQLHNDAVQPLIALRRRVRPEKTGLSRKTRDRLDQFATDDARRDLFQLPKRGFAEAEDMYKAGATRAAAMVYRSSLALAIELAQPFRLRNLATLDLKAHFIRDKHGKVRRIVVPADEVKNRRDIDVELPAELAKQIDRYIAVFRPILPNAANSTALFHGKNGKPMVPEGLAKAMTKLVARQLGLRFNVHLSRHLAATIILDAGPQYLAVVQRFLCHATPVTADSTYGITRTTSAQKHYAGMIEKLVGKPSAPVPGKASKRSKKGRSS